MPLGSSNIGLGAKHSHAGKRQQVGCASTVDEAFANVSFVNVRFANVR